MINLLQTKQEVNWSYDCNGGQDDRGGAATAFTAPMVILYDFLLEHYGKDTIANISFIKIDTEVTNF
jgi:hypothetical protein